MKTNATQRSLKYLRDAGWTVCIVEKFLPARGTMKFPRRIDAFNIGDLLACRDVDDNFCPECGHGGDIALVQTCPSASHAQHKEKILGIPEFHIWKNSGALVLLMSWAKKGPRGQRKTWQVREEYL